MNFWSANRRCRGDFSHVNDGLAFTYEDMSYQKGKDHCLEAIVFQMVSQSFKWIHPFSHNEGTGKFVKIAYVYLSSKRVDHVGDITLSTEPWLWGKRISSRKRSHIKRKRKIIDSKKWWLVGHMLVPCRVRIWNPTNTLAKRQKKHDSVVRLWQHQSRQSSTYAIKWIKHILESPTKNLPKIMRI